MNKCIFYWISSFVLTVLFCGCGNDAPVAAFTVSRTAGCYPLTVSFDASGSQDPDGNISTYSWSFTDGGYAEGAVVTHTFNMISIFNVELTVTDNDGCKSTASQSIMVGSLNGNWSGNVTYVSANGGSGPAATVKLFQVQDDPTSLIGQMVWASNPSLIWHGTGTVDTLTNYLVITWTLNPSSGSYQFFGNFTDDCKSFTGNIDGFALSNDIFTMTWVSP